MFVLCKPCSAWGTDLSGVHAAEVGLGFVLNHSGNVFSRLTPTLRDVACNAEASTLKHWKHS